MANTNFQPMPDPVSVADMIKSSTPIFTEDQQLKRAKETLRKIRALNFDQQLATKFGALKLYMDFFIEWKAAQAEKRLVFTWGWGKLQFSAIEVYERKAPHKFCPIMSFQEFSALLIIAYKYY